MTLRMRVLPRFPAKITGTNGLTVERPAGTPDLIVKPDFGSLVQIPNVGDGDNVFFMAWDRLLGLYRIMSFNDLFDGVADLGFMEQSVYDPQGKHADAFARANHTGVQAISTVTGLQTALDGKASKSIYASKSGNYTAVAGDDCATFRFTAAATLGFNAAATLAANWHCDVSADGGAVTLDPTGSETINGLATLVIPNGMMARVVCDGTQFFTVIRPSGLERIGGDIDLAGASNVTWNNLSSYRYLKLTLVGSLTAATTIFVRTSTNNGSSFDASASNYSYSSMGNEGATIGGFAVTPQTYIPLSLATQAANAFSINLSISEFNQARAPFVIADNVYFNNSGGSVRRDLNYGYRNDTTARNAFQVTFTSATTFASGKATLMGIRG